MDIQGFVQYLKGIIGARLSEWERNLLAGAYKTHEETQRAVGVREALSSVVQGVDTVLQNYITGETNPTPSTVDKNITVLNPDAPDVMPAGQQ